MRIGKEIIPRTAISTSNEDTIVVRGVDLCHDLIGKISFTEFFFLLLTGKMPSATTLRVLDATLVAIAEHGLVPSVQASRMTLAAAPDSVQGAVAAGILGCGSVILGAAEAAGHLFVEIKTASDGGMSPHEAARKSISAYHDAKRPIPGYGHPQHRTDDPRVTALFEVARQAGADMAYIEMAKLVEHELPAIVSRTLHLNVSAAIAAVLLGAEFPLHALKGVPILARTAGLIAHLSEEREQPIGFALSYQAARNAQYDGALPVDFRATAQSRDALFTRKGKD